MMENIDKSLVKVLVQIYKGIKENSGEVLVSSPEYKQTQVDELVSKDLVKKIDASTLSGWVYILRPANKGEKAIKELTQTLGSKVDDFVRRGIEIGEKESHTTQEPFRFTTVSGPLFDAWMSEINIFNERYLTNHPLHDSIHTTYFHRKNRSSYNDMMGHLRALAADEEFLGITNISEKEITIMRNESISQMLANDIERCKVFLENGEDEKTGIDLYIDITSRYDSIIPDFGSGLYQYYADQHFYDPDISGDTLTFNLKKLLNKMIAYQAMNCPKNTTADSLISTKNKRAIPKNNNKVFIVHGHDDLAKETVARSLEKMGFEAIILHEQPDEGKTVIEKIEANSDVAYAVVLYTECDLGRDKTLPESENQNRARQNVVFEHGYLTAKLGRDHVCPLVKGKVETPGDISGVVYTPMDDNKAWEMKLYKNMKAVGINVDLNKL